jgi:hexosaminidase
LLVTAGGGAPVLIGQATPIVVGPGDADGLVVARYLAALALKSRGLRLVPTVIHPPLGGPAILVERSRGGPGDEAYRLDIGDRQVTLSAATKGGLFYAAVTLWQIMTSQPGRGAVEASAVHIEDSPRFAWRGLLVDSARHLQSPDQIERLIDWMALHKLNVLQWHLTDDQGWRLEVPRYPRLTTIGAWRAPAFVGPPPGDPRAGARVRYGGFYTRAQVRRIVAYASARNVTIVPEVEMPGHVTSLLLAYPKLSAGPPPSASIQSDWGIFPYALGIDEPVFGFLDVVLDEVMDLFPSRFIAVGGDEVVGQAWLESPAVQARMKALGLADAAAVHAYFLSRVGRILAARGRRLIGWDEILEGGGLPAGDAVLSWRGAQPAVVAVNSGHDVVLAVSPTLYFDHRQSDLVDEPPGRGDVITLADVYAFDPQLPPPVAAEPTMPAPAPSGRVLGLEGALWTEHIATFSNLAAMAFPRAAAVAELGWSAPSDHDWRDFLARMPAEYARFRAVGLDEEESAVAVKASTELDGPGGVSVALSNQAGFGDIRFTLDGGAVGPSSALYAAPLKASIPGQVNAATFQKDQRISPILDDRLDALSLRRKVSQELQGCTNKLTLNLRAPADPGAETPSYLVDIMNPCWIWPGADLGGVRKLSVGVGRLPFNFQIGADREKILLHAPATRDGELEVHLDGCAGSPLAILPLAPALADRGPVALTSSIPAQSGRHDLCFFFTARKLDPMWVLGFVQLGAPAAGPAAAR